MRESADYVASVTAMKRFFVRTPAGLQGPLTGQDLRTWASVGKLHPGDLVRAETGRQWYLASEVVGLAFSMPLEKEEDAILLEPASESGTPVAPRVALKIARPRKRGRPPPPG